MHLSSTPSNQSPDSAPKSNPDNTGHIKDARWKLASQQPTPQETAADILMDKMAAALDEGDKRV